MTPTSKARPEGTPSEMQDPGATKASEPMPEPVEYVEFVGTEPYGAEFITAHTITRKQARDAWEITIPADLVWTKDRRKKDRMLVPTEGMSPELVEFLADDPMFKVVTE